MTRSFGARGGTLLVGLSAAVVLGGSAWGIARAYRSFDSATRPLNVPALARGRGFRVARTVTVLRSPEKLYAEWKDLTRWPELVPILQSVTLLDNVRSRWVARGPAGISVEWYAELEADEPNHLIAWRSIDPSDVNNAGSVRFVPAPGGRGTRGEGGPDLHPTGGPSGHRRGHYFREERRPPSERRAAAVQAAHGGA
jgi:uncharacterized membrane protein